MGCKTRNPTKLQERVVTGRVYAGHVAAGQVWRAPTELYWRGPHTSAAVGDPCLTLNPNP
jgi:hypothetical protein